MKLYIGNKNYSSWSLRPWLLMTHAGIEFEEIKLRLDFEEGSAFKAEIAKIAPTGRVPVLVDEGFAVWDTLAIAEYLAEKYPQMELWPSDVRLRARARSLCAEMHSGFPGLRSRFPMNIEASLGDVGQRVFNESVDARADLKRIDAMWTQQLEMLGGPFLFGRFTVADAYFAPVCWRARTYALPLSEDAAAYAIRMTNLPAMLVWAEAARAENDFIEADEPYRSRT